jgi:putative transposase
VARRPRIEFPGATYHVLNRGNYRADLFDTSGAAQAFTDCLFETCERMEWRLHAYCLMRNHYHLGVETPRGNLVTGVHWLQSTFGNRFNRFRGEHGRAFQGRYQAILVEPGIHLARLVDYIHLNPVRAGIIDLPQLEQFRWSSYRHFIRGRTARPAFLVCEDWLRAAGPLADSPSGWRAYNDRLAWLMADEGRQKAAAFEQMSQGWAIGSEDFQENLSLSFQRMQKASDWGGKSMSEINRREWQRLFDKALRALAHNVSNASSQPKAAPWKIAIATWLKQRTGVSNPWLTERLFMGPPDAVSRYVGECRRSQRPEAQGLVTQLTTKVRG